MKVDLFPRAEADIIRQFRYEAAIESVKEIRQHPGIGSLFRDSIPGLRSWQVKGFAMIRIYYLEVPGGLNVVKRELIPEE